MLRNPITLVASLIMLVSVGVLNYLHFTGSGESAVDQPAAVSPDEDAASSDLDLMVEKLAELRKPRSTRGQTSADLAGLTGNPFLYPEERRSGKSLREIEQELSATPPTPHPEAGPVTTEPPRDMAAQAELLKKLATVELTAIIWSDESAVAVLGGEILRQGDAILSGRAHVVRIRPAAVELDVGGDLVVKRLKPFEAVRPEEPPTQTSSGASQAGVGSTGAVPQGESGAADAGKHDGGGP